MREIVNADTKSMRMDGADEHTSVQPIRDKAEMPEGWLGSFHAVFGYAADEFLPPLTQFMRHREQELNVVADGHQESGDVLYKGANQFENTDADGGDLVQRSVPGSTE